MNSKLRELVQRGRREIPLPLALLMLAAAIWTGPLWLGAMPVSADHTVHLARAQAFCEQLGQGQLRGFSQMWGFGVPVGELYPVLGDLGYCSIRALGFSAQMAYAWTFALVMLTGVLCQYCLGASVFGGQQKKLAAVAGVLSALMWATDLGAYREGGWVYTVVFGVWPQSLATSLAWLALLALARAVVDPGRWRSAALLVAAALLAHPMALLHLGIVGLLWALTQRGSASASRALWCAAIGAGLSAWWWIPMLTHRAWMANYGWLFDSTHTMARAAMQGQITQQMPSLVGYAAILGILAALFLSRRWTKVLAASALLLWLLTSRSLFDALHFELWGSAWTHLQYQRFLISAKPALFALAALGLCTPAILIARALRKPLQPRMITLCTALSILSGAFMVQKLGRDLESYQSQAQELGWGNWPSQRLGPNFSDLDADYLEFLDWASLAHQSGERWRIHTKDQRNLHWFMDLVPLTGHQIYKSGFTPGDNFRHKPESRDPELLQALGLTHELSRVRADAPIKAGTRRWGRIELRPLSYSQVPGQPDWRAIMHDPEGQRLPSRQQLRKIDDTHWHLELTERPDWPLTVALPLPHYPRWQVRYLGQSIPTFASPALGANTGQRVPPSRVPPGRALGEDGRNPLLLSFEAPGPGSYEIEYIPSNWLDRLALWVSILCALSLATPRAPTLVKLRLNLVALAALLVIALALATSIGRSAWARQDHWLALFQQEDTKAHRIAPGLIKSNMVIERALIARPKAGAPATLGLRSDRWTPQTELWWSLDDDRAQRAPKPAPSYELRVWLGSDREGPPDLVEHFGHKPDRRTTLLDTRHLVGKTSSVWVELRSDRKRQTRIALDAHPVAP